MNVSLQNIDKVSALLTVKLEKADYQEKVDKSLKNFRQKAQIPGFRKGMVPMSLVKKMYGKSVLAEEVENVLRECALENAGHKEEAKDIVYFRMEEPAAPAVCRWEMLGYPLMSVLGIRSEDLQNN